MRLDKTEYTNLIGGYTLPTVNSADNVSFHEVQSVLKVISLHIRIMYRRDILIFVQSCFKTFVVIKLHTFRSAKYLIIKLTTITIKIK